MSVRIRWRRWIALLALLVLVVPPIWVELRDADRKPASIVVPAADGDRYTVHVVDWGYHTAIIIEQPRGWRLGPEGEEDARYVEYAWGDRRFYMESNYWPHSVFATLFLPTAAVTYVDGRPRPPTGGFRSMHVREVGAEQLRALAAELERFIVRDAAGARLPAHPPVSGYAGRFHPGIGRYTWWTNCNRWTVERLAAAGLASGGRGVLFSPQVASHLVGFVGVEP